jgi:dCMP deaminase
MTPKRKSELNYVFMAMASVFATMSLATRSQVGALIVKDGNIESTGWNGMPSGFPNDELELLQEPPAQLSMTMHALVGKPLTTKLVTNPLVLHAESNAIMRCARRQGFSTHGAHLYVTMSPCPDCAKLIIQSGISKVFYRDKYRITTGLDVLKRAKIPCSQLSAKRVAEVHHRALQALTKGIWCLFNP